MESKVFAIVCKTHWEDFVNEEYISAVFVHDFEAEEYIERMEQILRNDYNWEHHRPQYEEVVRTDNGVRCRYNNYNIEYKIVETSIKYN